MSDFSLDDDLVQCYLAESREHLATIETDLLQVEQAGAEIDEQLVNRVFRAAHSIKGGAGFFDLTRIRELAHKTENVLDMVRSRELIPTPEIVNVLLLAFDKLRDLLDRYASSNNEDISDFVAALSTLTVQTPVTPVTTGPPQEQQVGMELPDPERFREVSTFDLQHARGAGNRIFRIHFDLLADIQRRNLNPLDVFRNLMGCGQILDSSLDMTMVGTLEDEPTNSIMLEVLYASRLNNADLREFLSLREDQVVCLPAPEQIPAAEVRPLQVVPMPLALPPATAPTNREAAGPTVEPAAATQAEATVRLNVSLLDSLMTLAGELVLGRNQMNEALASRDERAITASANRISAATSELQEAVTLTRMQPVGALFAKFPRLVRDLSRTLGKDVQLKLEGGEVELDKTILEGLSDPLTHMVRNSVDHGIEPPDVRLAAGKSASGTVILRASHQGGQVVIEIRDDGKGLRADRIAASSVAKGLISQAQVDAMSEREKILLIFLPGMSTAETVSDVSGRGVGMDVVRTNLDKLGGKIEIDSTPGKGATFRIKLPLTLAIIPSLLVSQAGARFAIPQVSVGELIRIPAARLAERLDRAGGAEVLLLRDRLVPILYLAEALGLARPEQGAEALNVVLLGTGTFEFGLVVEKLHDTLEIVVKPLGRHLQGLCDYAGATILGNGEVALILDAAGLAERAGMKPADTMPGAAVESERESKNAVHSLLLFHNAPGEACAIPIEQVKRVDSLAPAKIEYLGGRRTMQYEGSSLPLVMLHDTANVGELEPTQNWVVILFERVGRSFGLVAAEPLAMLEAEVAVDSVTLRQPGVGGSAVLNGRTTLMLDAFELASSAMGPEEVTPGVMAKSRADGETATVLIAEDSEFFRNQIQRLVEAVGYRTMTAPDGQAAWEMLSAHAGEVALVATDVEMPRMDGLALTRQIRGDSRFSGLPIIALSSLAGEAEIAKGMEAGVSEYQIKLDGDMLISSIRKSLANWI